MVLTFYNLGLLNAIHKCTPNSCNYSWSMPFVQWNWRTLNRFIVHVPRGTEGKQLFQKLMEQSLQFPSRWPHCEASVLDWGSCHHSLMPLLHNYLDARGVFSLARWSFTWNSSISIHFNLFKFCEMSLDRTAKRKCRLTTTINYWSSLIDTLQKLSLWRTQMSFFM